MERIKQALDKARSEKEPRGQDRSIKSPKTGVDGGSKEQEFHFEYLQTRIHALDPAKLRESRVVVGEGDRHAIGAYKMLRTQIMQRMGSQGWNTLAVTSPAPGDGKTVTCINLAISLARELHHTVLLVDMDLRNPCVHKCFGLNPAQGISDFLLQSVPLSDVLVNPGIDRLVLLPGREAMENSSELLAGPTMGKLVQELKTRYPSRIVLFDLPPILSADDALSFGPFVDAFLLVFRDGKTTRTEVERAMEILKDVPIIGSVLNASNEKISTYY